MQHLTELKNLEILELSGTQISKLGLTQLAKLPKLRLLMVMGIPLTDDDLQPLTLFPALNELLFGPGITKAAAQRLQQQMPRCMIHHEDPTGTNTFTLLPLQK